MPSGDGLGQAIRDEREGRLMTGLAGQGLDAKAMR
jgi:hypothetical protein